MKQWVITVLISAFIGSAVFAEEPKEKPPGAERPSRERPRRPRDRKDYRQRQVELKDPAGFSKSQSSQVFSGPQVGEKLPSFPVTSIYGELEGQKFDVIERAQGEPQVLILSDDGGVGVRGIFGFSRFSSTVALKSTTGLHVSVLFLDDDPAKISQFASRFGERLSQQVDVIGVSPDGRDGPGAYGLNRNVAQTIIFAKDGQVTHNFVFPQGMLLPDPHVLGALADVVGEDRKTVEVWLNENRVKDERMAARGRRLKNRERDGEDPRVKFRVLLGNFVEAGKISREEAGKLYRAAFPADEGNRR